MSVTIITKEGKKASKRILEEAKQLEDEIMKPYEHILSSMNSRKFTSNDIFSKISEPLIKIGYKTPYYLT